MKKSTIILIIIAVLVVIGLVWAFNTNKAVTPENGVVQNGEIDTSDWQTYRNEELGFEFRYPQEWGEVRQSNILGQLRIASPESSFNKILINTNDLRPTGLRSDKLASLQDDLDCGFNLNTFRELSNGKFALIYMEKTENILKQNDCHSLVESLPVERKEKRTSTGHAYTVVYLDEHEIPEVMQEDYQEFKLFMESFKTI